MTELEGRWSDGRSSRVRPVRIRLASAGVLQIELARAEDGAAADAGTLFWPVGETRISPRLGRTPRVLRRVGHGQVECPDSPLLDRWFPGGSGRVEGFVDWLERRRAAIVGAAVVVVALAVGFIHFGLPAVAKVVAERMPRSVEQHVSDQVVALLERTQLEPSDLPEVRQRALRQAFQRLVAGEPRAVEMVLHFTHAPAIGPNAFALPDGRIYLTDALVELAGNDAEVLAVLAHEAGHHVHRHGMRGALEDSSIFLLAGVLFGDVSGSSLAVSLPAALLSSRFSRSREREADDYAFILLKHRGRSPKAFADVMRRLSQNVPKGMEKGAMGYLSSHPASPERIAAAEAAAR